MIILLLLARAGIIGKDHNSKFMRCWGLNPELPMC